MNRKNATRFLAMLLCLVMLFLTGCTATPTAEQTETDGEKGYQDTITLYFVSSKLVPFDFDGGAATMTQLMTHDRLVEKNYAEQKPLDILPGLATEWEWIDDTTLEFKLREDAVFHNGEPFTSDDVVFTFNDCVLTHTQASKVGMLDHVEAVDDYTVRFFLKYHHSDFLVLLSQTICSIVNREAVEENEVEGSYVGTGPYILTNFVQGDEADVERNDNYWGKKGITRHFHFRSVPEAATSLMALENGEMSAATFDVVDMPHIQENPDLDAIITPNMILYFAMNTSKDVGMNKDLRLAIAHCIKYDDWLAFIDPGYSVTTGTFWGMESFGRDDSIPLYEYDLDLAKEYLDKSGVKEITISCITGYASIAELLQAQCKQIGLTVNIEAVDSSALSAMTRYDTAEHQSILAGFTANEYGDDCRRPYYPNSNINKAILNDPRINELIDAAAQEEDEAKRIEMYHEIQQINHEECYYLPLVVACETTAYTTRLKGVNWAFNGRHQWTYAYIEE
jgi:peptide/nickel transport system substrate-binding protein